MPELDAIDIPTAKFADSPALSAPVKLHHSTRDLPRAEIISLAGQALGFMDSIASMLASCEAALSEDATGSAGDGQD
jgi:hypothetical protein